MRITKSKRALLRGVANGMTVRIFFKLMMSLLSANFDIRPIGVQL